MPLWAFWRSSRLVSRRLSIVVGFYRVCVIDQILTHSPADYVRRPTVPAESPALGLGHLQFEALITTARLSANPNDFALVALLGLPGLRIFEARGASISDLGEEHGHLVLRVRGKGSASLNGDPVRARADQRASCGRSGLSHRVRLHDGIVVSCATEGAVDDHRSDDGSHRRGGAVAPWSRAA
jgi:integrase/recombinase XerD